MTPDVRHRILQDWKKDLEYVLAPGTRLSDGIRFWKENPQLSEIVHADLFRKEGITLND